MRLTTIAILLLAGILAGTQLGKIAPLVNWYQQEIGFSLVLTGWFTAMIGLFVALAALPAGWAIEAFGVRRAFIVSSAVLAVGGIALSFFTLPIAILGARLVEGLGYLALVIAIPALLNSIPAPRFRPAALAVWGGFVPLGYAVGDFLARAIDAPANPQHFLLVAILLFVAMATPAALLLLRVGDSDAPAKPEHSAGGRFLATTSLPVVLVALAFGIYVILSLGFFAFLPKFLQSAGSAVWLSAGAISLTVPLGNLLAGLLVRGNARSTLLLAALGLAASALVAIPAFAGVEGVSATAALVAFAVAGGVVASALFAVIPAIVPRDGSAAVAIGLVCQAGGIGTVVGPPLAAYVIDTHGWTGVAWYMVAVSLAGIASLVPLLFGRAIGTERAALDRG